ncbi:MAG: DegT/DnrJ/EryC1/StrS family aminotransferase, partial [Pseudomonadota bacterium]|nr:DegT/DnrJ/EryC1/StrS family aminotransferase [Pseudomonadota bacterium]
AKRRVFRAYSERLHGLPLTMNPEPPGTTNGYWMPTIVVDDGVEFDRQMLLDAFKADQIDSRVFFWPLSSLPPFERRANNRVSYGLYGRACNLPSYHDLSLSDIDRVCAIVRRCLA